VNNNLNFRQSKTVTLKLILFLAASIFFLIIDSELKISNEIRKNTSYIISPIYSTAELPTKLYYVIDNYLVSKNNLLEKNKILEKKYKSII
jgi:cell shape-determining protein MreC